LANTTIRYTVSNVPKDISFDEARVLIADSGRRRLLSWGFDFDSRAAVLLNNAGDFDEGFRNAELERLRVSISAEFGERNVDQKVTDFIDIDTKPMSVLAYHNAFFAQVRSSFVAGAYYPALVGACALGERILNHLVIDMRPFFKHTAEYKSIYRKNSFDNWNTAIDVLVAWKILLPIASEEFRKLKQLRDRSIHFNVATYNTLREDALAAIIHMRTIIEQQFGSFALRPWFIEGTKGHVFIRKAYEDHPFVKTYFIPRCPFVGPLFGMGFTENVGWDVFDMEDYGDGEWTDDEFRIQYNERNPEDVVTERPSTFPDS
jgi:hypothetical protein